MYKFSPKFSFDNSIPTTIPAAVKYCTFIAIIISSFTHRGFGKQGFQCQGIFCVSLRFNNFDYQNWCQILSYRIQRRDFGEWLWKISGVK